LADRLEIPLLLITGAALPMLAFAIHKGGWSWSVTGAAILTLLAALEYVNYYHRQLQHFDRSSDFKRLMTGGGFRRSHMARDLAAYRRER
jgi:membrane protein YdbS with pleckstrin-like domain